MKKFIYVAIMTFVMIGMSACSKDTDLTGTKWVCQQTFSEQGFTITMTATLSFTSETEGNIKVVSMGESDTKNFTYTYDGDGNGTMTAEGETISFTIEDDQLTVTEDGVSMVFTKQ